MAWSCLFYTCGMGLRGAACAEDWQNEIKYTQENADDCVLDDWVKRDIEAKVLGSQVLKLNSIVDFTA